jgi:NAD(P)-dependent dehydrogenase (short-subunit alcohol dehydrogenase family)
MAGQFSANVALVTGAGSGIGRASALALAREGAQVVVADIAREGGEETVRRITGAGGEARFVCADVAQASDVEALIATTVATYGRLDFAHNNAGIVGAWGTSLIDYPRDVWDRVFSVNVTGVWLCMSYEIPQMLRQGSGAIVNTASMAGLVGTSSDTAYCASKHAVIGLTKAAAVGYAQQGIRVNAVCPTFIRTPMLERVIEVSTQPRDQVEAAMTAYEPMGRMGTVEEVAAAVVWLCSDASAFVTGHALPIDGGALAR